MQTLYRRFQPRFTVGAVGVLLNDDHEILLVEHVFHPLHPWGLPGGWVDANELPSVAVQREFSEEMNLSIEVVMPLEIWSNKFWFNHLDMAFIVKLTEPFPPTVELSAELTDYQWFKRDELPHLLPDHYRIIDLALRYHHLMHANDKKEISS